MDEAVSNEKEAETLVADQTTEETTPERAGPVGVDPSLPSLNVKFDLSP